VLAVRLRFYGRFLDKASSLPDDKTEGPGSGRKPRRTPAINRSNEHESKK
jgi:hypothetical protein